MNSNVAALIHPNDRDLELYLLEGLPEKSLSAIEAHLADCNVCDQRLAHEISALSASGVAKLGTALTGEMRKEPRYKTDEAVSLQALNPFSLDRHSGRLADVSRNGMKLQVPERVESGTLIKIGLQNMFAFGEVRYCTPVVDGFHLGVQVLQTVQVRNPK